MKIYKFKRLRSRLTFWFLVVFLVPVSAEITVVYLQQKESIRIEATNKLEAVREMKAQRLNEWIEERSIDIQTASRNLQLANLEEAFSKSPQDFTERDHRHIEDARRELRLLVNSSRNYRELFVINHRNKQTAISTKEYREGMDRSTAPYYLEPLKKRGLYISDIYFSDNERIPVMEFSHPIFCSEHDGKHIVGVLAARIDLFRSLYPMLLERTGMGKTGETLIVDHRAKALNQLRYRENAPFNLRISAEPSRLALKKLTGIIEAKDYRGELVLASYTYIPDTRWGFVAKQDVSELYAPLRALVKRFAIALIVLVAVIAAFAALIARAISKPVLEVAEVAQTITEGNTNARCVVGTSDEAASMARSINKMAETLLSRSRIGQAVGDIFDTVAVGTSIGELGVALLDKLITVTNASIGVFYRISEDKRYLEPIASLGCSSEAWSKFDIHNLEGQLGSAVLAKRPVFFDEIPEQTIFRFKTVAGEAVPTRMATIPLLVDNEVAAVIALASFQPFSREDREIVEQILVTLSTSFANLLAGEKTAIMAEELRSRNEVLAANNEALQAQAEELRRQARELKKLSAELAEERERVAEADRLKSEFLSNMSHELRTPLNSIMALSQLMMSRGTGRNTQQELEFLQIIERNGRQLLSLINDILDLSKIEAGRVDIETDRVDLPAVVKAAVYTVRPLAEQKQLELIVNLPEIPFLFSDEDKIRRVLINLLSNAVKFTDRGTITVNASVADEFVTVEVRDTGIGISPIDQANVFDAFRQVDGSTTRRHDGTGLGLAISHKLALLLGGELSLESAPGCGSCFSLKLPTRIETKATSDSMPTAVERQLRSQPDALLSGTRRLVLVIDDDAVFRSAIRQHLTGAGYAVVVADRGQQGLDLARRLRPFAITLDVFMPEMDGWEILKELKSNPDTAAIPVIIVSVSEDRAMGFALGAAGYLVKPVDAFMLIAELERIHKKKSINRILVVDDDPAAREVLCDLLREKYSFIDQAKGGLEALSIARSNTPPDVMILDLMMPDMDGFTVLDSLREDERTRAIPVIVVTAKDLSVTERLHLREASRRIIGKDGLNRDHLLNEITSALAEIEENRSERTSVNPKMLAIEEDSTGMRQRRSATEQSGDEPDVASSRAAAFEHSTDFREVSLSNHADQPRPSILVVEDNPDNLTTIGAILEGLEADVISAKDAPTALEITEQIRPALILMDIHLPGLSGLEATRQIKNRPGSKAIPIIALTAKAMKGDREQIIEAGCDDYLAKPIDPDLLKETVGKWMKDKGPTNAPGT